jgi:ankyrin repeat protein
MIDYKDDVEFAIFNNNIGKLKNTFKIKGIKPNYDNNYPLSIASEQGKIKIVKALLEYPEVDPSDNCNRPIRNAFKNKQEELVLLLWNNERVKKTLKEDEIDIYNKLISLDIKNKLIIF